MKKTGINLIPKHKNPTPDYYCTWQTQLYATSDGKPEGQRAIIGEKALFDTEKPFGWAYFYEKAREDLFFVMDDSWDVSLCGERKEFGSLILNAEKFPDATADAKNNAEAIGRLCKKMHSLGWKGLGGWVCAQEAEGAAEAPESYWKKRLQEANEAGFAYWKVDWGKKGTDLSFRRMLTALAKDYAPHLTVEHAMRPEIIRDADVFRTYDVPALMSIPMTMEKLSALSAYDGGLINCEDEVYMAAAGGFAMGVMRHPYDGAFPDGKADMSFPSIHRNCKTKMTEIVRAVRFHRIAPAFSGAFQASDTRFCDTWRFACADEEMESWWFENPLLKNDVKDGVLTRKAPAMLARNCDFPKIVPDEKGDAPFVVISRNPNGVFAVATLGRTRERDYWIPRCDLELEMQDADTVGVFGAYRRLILHTARTEIHSVLMQDLAGACAYDVTDAVIFSGGTLTIDGALIETIGREENPSGDTSEAGVLLKIQ